MKWGMRFQPVKLNMMQLTRKHLNKIQASYTLEDTVFENVDNIINLGVTITNDLKWNTHISNICTKANRILGFLRRTLFSCPKNVKEATVWPNFFLMKVFFALKGSKLLSLFVTRNYVNETGSMTGILGQLKW